MRLVLLLFSPFVVMTAACIVGRLVLRHDYCIPEPLANPQELHRQMAEVEKPKRFQFRIQGHLNAHWKEWLNGLDIAHEELGVTVLSGDVVDQPQLHGILIKIRDLGLSLISVREQPESPNWLEKPQDISIGKALRLYSQILGEERQVLISLPEGYEGASDRWAVLYQLDGYPILFQHAVATLRYLAEWEKAIPPLILVAIPNSDRDRDLFPTRVTLPSGKTIGGGADNFLSFIECELAPFIEGRFPTLPNRILYGTSNSGLTAVYALLRKENFFGAVIASSPTLSWDDRLIFRQAEEVFRSWQSPGSYLYLTCGQVDLGTIHQETLDFAAYLAESAPPTLTWGMKVSEEARHCPYNSLHNGLMALFSDWGFRGG